MRKYTRPTYVKVEEIDKINETIFLFGSGDIWTKSTCFHIYPVVQLQGPGVDQLDYFVFSVACQHDSSGFTDLHHNKGQNYIFTFNMELPVGTKVTTQAGSSTLPGIVNDDRVRVLFTRERTAEVEDRIEFDDFNIYFDFSQSDNPSFNVSALRCTALDVNDYWLRTANPSLQH